MKPTIAKKIVLLLILASLVPLAIFGAIAIHQVNQATAISVTEGNQNVSRRVAEQIGNYIDNALAILRSTAENLSAPDLHDWQKERILRNYINRFDQFRSLQLLSREGTVIATSELAAKPLSEEEKTAFAAALKGQEYLSRVLIQEDLTPSLVVALPMMKLAQVDAVFLAKVDLMQMWYLVDSIHIGKTGVVHVLDQNGRLIATGDGRRKQDVFRSTTFEHQGLLEEILRPQGTVYPGPDRKDAIAVGTRLKAPLPWRVIVEQPSAEAFRLARRIGYVLVILTVMFIFLALGIGFWGSRTQILRPIRELMTATGNISGGNLSYRVVLKTRDEFQTLGEAFNRMAVDLTDLQQKLLVQERHAMFGRIASGLAHDLKHPIQAIENVSRLIDRMHEDEEFRNTFRRTVEREFEKINLFLQNLHNLTHDLPCRPMPTSAETLLKDVWGTFEIEANKNGIQGEIDLPKNDIRIVVDKVLMNRALSNLVSNGIQAMPRGGKIKISVKEDGAEAVVSICDTGMGIPPERIQNLFNDFVTTKRRGLGLGLAIVRKIIQQHQGSIDVQSKVGEGTCFLIRLPKAASPH